MTEIWNLSALCRCCHLDGNFKSLDQPFMYKNEVEVYSVMLQEALGVTISKPPENLSYSICDVCIYKLRETINFKLQIVTCEEKFNEYLRNEEALTPAKEIKMEIIPYQYNNDLLDTDNGIKHEIQFDSDNDNTCEMDECGGNLKKEEIKNEYDDKEYIKETCLKTKLKNAARKLRKSSKLRNNAKKPKLEKTEKKLCSKVIPCDHCSLTFSSVKKLNKHYHTHHQYRGPYTCTQCEQQHDDIDHMYDHVKTHDLTRVKCRFCDKDFASKRSLQDHENCVHIRKCLYICDICNKRFSYKSTLRKHFLWHNGLNKKAFCELCGHGFNDNTNLRSHVEAVHLKLRKFACTQCDKTFTANKHLKNHVASTHDGLKPYSCKLCSTTYCDWKSYKQHKTRHELIDPNKHKDIDLSQTIYRCKVCSETFDHRGRFKAHVMKHNRDGTSPNICHICGRGFSCKYSLNRHVDNHNGLKLFPCDICQKRFSQKALVERHKKSVHDPVKKEKIKCPICKSNVRDMEKHKKKHIVRPFSCEICAKSYPEKNTLNRHVKQFHLGIFKHVCAICNTKCKTAKLLAKHNRARHPELKLVDYELPVTQFPDQTEQE